MRIRIIAFLTVVLSWFALSLSAAEPIDVSLLRLIANPKEYDGKTVRVIGFVRLEFEGNAIYLHREDYQYFITKNGLWIDATDAMRKSKADLDQKYVVLEGKFNADRQGHMGLWSGCIEKITRADVARQRESR